MEQESSLNESKIEMQRVYRDIAKNYKINEESSRMLMNSDRDEIHTAYNNKIALVDH